MRRYFGLLIGAVAALAALGGCDERKSARQDTKTEKAGNAAPAPSTRLGVGVGWHAVADTRLSSWGFAESHRPPGRMLATQSNATGQTMAQAEGVPADALAPMRVALMANTLPARGSVRIEELVNRASTSVVISGQEADDLRPRAILTTTPWNDDTILLWIEVPGAAMAGDPVISVEFEQATVAAFRTLGDPGALPAPQKLPSGLLGGVAMIYELVPQPTGTVDKGNANIRYAVLHLVPHADGGAKLDQPVTGADAVGTIDNAPEVVRISAAAAGFGELLRGDPAVRDLSCNDVIALAQSVQHPDPDGWRARLIALMYRAQPLIDLPPRDSAK